MDSSMSHSEPGKGTTFQIYLPLLEEAAAEERRESTDLPVKGGSETILVAEDNDAIRSLFSTILEFHGYTVITAINGEEAVIKFKENRDHVRLVILDGIMPKKNGKEACQEIRIINPTIKSIFVSGYAEDIISKDGLLAPGTHFIQKPVTPLALLTTVREVLDA